MPKYLSPPRGCGWPTPSAPATPSSPRCWPPCWARTPTVPKAYGSRPDHTSWSGRCGSRSWPARWPPPGPVPSHLALTNCAPQAWARPPDVDVGQCTRTAGRIENSQVAVVLAYAADAGHAFVDRELYLLASGPGPVRQGLCCLRVLMDVR